MAATKKGERLGPFQLGKRYKHASAELGHIHEARNVQTGAPALVMMPGPRPSWGPKKNWRVRASFQSTPPFMSLEVEQAPASGRLADLADLFTLLLAALEAVGSNARMRAHLTGSPMGQWEKRPWLRGLVAAGLAVLVLAGGFLWWGMGTRPVGPPSPPPSSGLAELADAGVTSSFLIDGEAQRPAAGIAYPLPDKPFSNQVRPPCRTKADHVAINGGCWIEIARRPPCDEDHAEYQGKCYIPIMKAPRPPQSLSP
ncbi:hypothetical protein BO221_50605 [Archangium sp. Cb G35]|uniref:hypothetical protein n=1 Tax=Archangium sp. Cb G35 TaxID=1920190 RepID=UPI000935964B|nr:hypothetical protein [Archangium sp. Cb G35]OJT16350.1 hypothetical protein BO221_50605 [Archangium sp. Cb G35]